MTIHALTEITIILNSHRKEGFEKEQFGMQTRLEHLKKENEDMTRRYM